MQQDLWVLEVWMELILFSWENINKQTARTLNRTGITANVMTQTVSPCSCQHLPSPDCASPMVYLFELEGTPAHFDCITPVPKNLLMDCVVYSVFELRWNLFTSWRDTTGGVLIWFWLNLENSLTLWREFERSQSSKNQYGFTIPRWIALSMYHLLQP